MRLDELTKYIETQLLQGVPVEKTASFLRVGGWSDEEIKKAIADIPNLNSKKHLVYSAATEQRFRKVHPFLYFLSLCLACLVIAFMTFSILFNLGLIVPEENLELNRDVSENLIQNEKISENKMNSEVNEVTPVTLAEVGNDEKVKIVAALLKLKGVLESYKVKEIRNYLKMGATAIESERFTSMTDPQMLLYSSQVLKSLENFTPEILYSEKTTWKRTSETSVEVTVTIDSTKSKREVRLLKGVWY